MRSERLTGFLGLEILGTGMARKLRLEYEGAIYHVMDRGDRREDIFWDDEDRERFMETLDECCGQRRPFGSAIGRQYALMHP